MLFRLSVSEAVFAAQYPPAIDDRIDDDNQAAEKNLNVGGEVRWIQYRHEVMLDEIAVVGGHACPPPQPVFQIGEGANEVQEFHQRTPDDGGQMQPDHPWPAEQQQPARDYKDHEAKMDDDDGIGQVEEQQTRTPR